MLTPAAKEVHLKGIVLKEFLVFFLVVSIGGSFVVFLVYFFLVVSIGESFVVFLKEVGYGCGSKSFEF